jgi:hypothetical protein
MSARQLRSRNQVPAMDYFYSAAKHRSRGALWPIFAPALIDTEYQFCCRVMDIAGNSLPLQQSPPSAVIGIPQTTFSRVEPFRAPEILLTHPIDQVASPGEHIDYVVARDGDAHRFRMLMAPRESLRLASPASSRMQIFQLPRFLVCN